MIMYICFNEFFSLPQSTSVSLWIPDIGMLEYTVKNEVIINGSIGGGVYKYPYLFTLAEGSRLHLDKSICKKQLLVHDTVVQRLLDAYHQEVLPAATIRHQHQRRIEKYKERELDQLQRLLYPAKSREPYLTLVEEAEPAVIPLAQVMEEYVRATAGFMAVVQELHQQVENSGFYTEIKDKDDTLIPNLKSPA